MLRLKKWYLKKYPRRMLLIIRWAQKVSIPGFNHIPLYNVGVFFMKGLKDGAISTRASSVAFNLFLALFPAIIFIFTLIPIIPIRNFQIELLSLIESIVPVSAYAAIQKTIEDIITIPHEGLLSFGFIMALIFSSNGIVSLIEGFNASVNVTDTRSWFQLRAISLLLLIILSLLVTTAITLITFTHIFLKFLVDQGIMEQNFTYYAVIIGKWIIILALFYFAYSFLFYIGPARKSKFQFISAGSTLATLLSIAITFVFSFYIDHFGTYNALYGSIGTLPVLMLMVYLNCVVLIVGFELNIGILAAKRETKDSGLKLQV